MFRPDPALGVVVAARGYPSTAETGVALAGTDAAEEEGALVFHAGTRMAGDRLESAGGRVLCVVATAPTIARAQGAAYRAVDRIDLPGGFCRRDIGWRAVGRDGAG